MDPQCNWKWKSHYNVKYLLTYNDVLYSEKKGEERKNRDTLKPIYPRI